MAIDAYKDTKNSRLSSYKELVGYVKQLNSADLGNLVDLKTEKEELGTYDVDAMAKQHCKRIR